jgi:peptidoglycan/LPS O-acetylase OafA/YrhL
MFRIDEMNRNSTHIPVLNSLRAIAALSVCLFHYVCTVTGLVTNENILWIFSFGHYGVQMFFVISGFIIPWSMYHSRYELKNFFTFTAKRLIRLEPPYLISLLFAILHTYVRTLSPHYNGVDITPTFKQILLHFGYLVPFYKGVTWIRQVYWTLAVEFQYYIAIGLLFGFISSNKLFLRIGIYILFLSGPLMTSPDFLPYHLPVFLVGILLFLLKAGIIKTTEFWIVNGVTFCTIVYLANVPTFLFCGFTFVAIMYFSNIKSVVGDFLGNVSYSLYLFHSLTGMVLLNYAAHSVTSPFVKFFLILIAVLLSIGVSYVVYRFVEKPSKELSSKIKYKR